MSGIDLAIEARRPLASEVRRIATALAEDAIARLEGPDEGSRESAVHEARKRFKELRALLRLMENAAGRKRTAEARRQLRDAGRSLSGARDADALHETVEKLQARFGAFFGRSRGFTAALAESVRSMPSESGRAVQLAASFRDSAALWSFSVSGDDVTSALRASIRAARRAMKTAIAERSAEAFHEWRKREKDLWYHARITIQIIPAMADREPQLRKLARILGDHHDLVVMREIAAAHADATNAADAINVLTLARERMRELEAGAEELGHSALDPNFDLVLRNDSAQYQAFALA